MVRQELVRGGLVLLEGNAQVHGASLRHAGLPDRNAQFLRESALHESQAAHQRRALNNSNAPPVSIRERARTL